jgi:hypothetical protein
MNLSESYINKMKKLAGIHMLNEVINIDTKVVDSNGKPLLMYHGGSYTGGEFKGGWFTSEKADARYYAKQNHGIVTKAYLIIKNPLYAGHIKELNIKISKDILTSAKKRNISNAVVVKDGIIEFIETNAANLIAQDIGRDGVIDIESGQILDAIVFSHNQIIINK